MTMPFLDMDVAAAEGRENAVKQDRVPSHQCYQITPKGLDFFAGQNL